MRRHALWLVATVLGVNCSPSAWARSGALDVTFAGTGVAVTAVPDAIVRASVRQSDGKVVVVGGTADAADDWVIVRFNADGTLDGGFGASGVVTTSIDVGVDTAFAVLQQTDGKLVVGGSSDTGLVADVAGGTGAKLVCRGGTGDASCTAAP